MDGATHDIIRKRKRPSSDLIANCSQDERRTDKELRGAGIKLRNDRGHVPFELAPDVRVSGRDKDRRQCAEGADDGQRKVLVRTAEMVP